MKWTPDIVSRVRRDAPRTTREQMAKSLGVSVNALDGAVQRYGFHFLRAVRVMTIGRVVVSDPVSALSDELRAEIAAARQEASHAPLYRRPTLF